MEKEQETERQRIKSWICTGKRLYEIVSTRSGLVGIGYSFENDKSDTNKKDLKNRFVKASTDKTVKVSDTFSSNHAFDEKVTFHEEIKNAEKVFTKKTSQRKTDVKKTSADAQKKKTGENVGLITKGQFQKKLGKVTGKHEPRVTPKRNRNGKQGIKSK